jgi:hypothetical protein
MLIRECDFHTRYQQIAMANDETGELLLAPHTSLKSSTLSISIDSW